MAIAFDNTASGTNTGSTTLTYSHTCAGNNRILFVGVFDQSGIDSVTGITYNGTALTFIGKVVGAGDTRFNYLYYLTNPASGTNNVVVTRSSSTSIINSNSASYSGVDQTSPINASNTGTASSNPLTVSVTSTADNCWTVLFAENGQPPTASTGTTARSGFTGIAGVVTGIGDSNGPIHPAGSNSMSAVATGSINFGGIIAAFKPFVTTSLYWVGGTGNWDVSTETHWSGSSGSSGGGFGAPVSSTNVFIDGNSGVGTITLTADNSVLNFDCTGYTGTFTGTNALSMFGNFTLGSGMTYSLSGNLNFVATTTGKTIVTSGKVLHTVVFNGVGGGWIFNDTPTITNNVTLTNGSLNLGSTTVQLHGTGTVWSAVPAFNLTPGTSTIKITDASSSAKTFAGGGLAYNNLWITGSGTGAYTISGSNTFNDFKADMPPHTINFTAGTTQHLTTFTVNGSAGNLMTLQSTVPGSAWFLVQNGSNTIRCDYLSLQDSHVS